jgi:hypothetical protein
VAGDDVIGEEDNFDLVIDLTIILDDGLGVYGFDVCGIDVGLLSFEEVETTCFEESEYFFVLAEETFNCCWEFYHIYVFLFDDVDLMDVGLFIDTG